MDFLLSFATALKFSLLNMAWIFIVLCGIERLWPKSPVTLASQLRSLKFWLFYAVAGAVIVTAFAYLKQTFPDRPLYVIPLKRWLENSPLYWAIYIIGPLAGMAIYDFFNYWMHRAQHKWFWAQHSIHHSIENLSAVNSYFHWTEHLFRIICISAPMALLFNINHGGERQRRCDMGPPGGCDQRGRCPRRGVRDGPGSHRQPDHGARQSHHFSDSGDHCWRDSCGRGLGCLPGLSQGQRRQRYAWGRCQADRGCPQHYHQRGGR